MRPITLVLTVLDGKDLESQMLLNITNTSDTTDIDDQLEVARIVQTLVDPLITGAIIRCGLIVDVELDPGIKTTADVDSDVEEGGLFIWNSDSGHNTQTRLPTFSEAKLLPSSRIVDLSDVDVSAFNDAIIDGIEVTPPRLIEFQDNRGDDITLLRQARETIGKSRL